MLKFNPNVKLTAIDSSYTEGADVVVSLYFNTRNSVVSAKSILDLLIMLDGRFTFDEIVDKNIGHKDINARQVLTEFMNWGLISDVAVDCSDGEGAAGFSDYIAHFPKFSNITFMIAVMLQKFGVKSIMYADRLISQTDICQNIYFGTKDIGKDLSTFLHEMDLDNISIAPLPFDIEARGCKDIVVNSDMSNWNDLDNSIVMNTWNYRSSHFENFCLINANMDISEDLKEMIDAYILAIRSVCDIGHCIKNGQVI